MGSRHACKRSRRSGSSRLPARWSRTAARCSARVQRARSPGMRTKRAPRSKTLGSEPVSYRVVSGFAIGSVYWWTGRSSCASRARTLHRIGHSSIPSRGQCLGTRIATFVLCLSRELTRAHTACRLRTLRRRYCAGGAAVVLPTGWVTILAPASLSSRLNSGESRMIVTAAARRRSTASGGRTNDVGRSFR
jgi:hypothetical protein